MTIYCPRCGQAGCDETVISFVSVWASCARCHLVWRSSLLETVVGYAARGVGLSKSQKIAARYNALQAAEELQQPSGSLKPVSVDVDRVAEWLASQDRPTGAPRLAVTPHSAAEAEKVEEMFDMLDPVKKSGMSSLAPTRATVPARATADDDRDFSEFFSAGDQAQASACGPISQTASAFALKPDIATADKTAEKFVAPIAPVAPVAPSDPLSFEDVLCEPEVPLVVQPAVAKEVIAEDVIEEPADVSVEEMAVESSVDSSVDSVDSLEDPLTSMEDLYEAFKRLEQQLDTISDSLQTYTQHP